MKIIFVCSVDANYRKYMTKAIKKLMPLTFVKECKSQTKLFRRIRKFDELYIICDQFFLGFRLTEKLIFIRKYLSETSKVMVTAWDVKEDYFGVRLKKLGFNGFLNHVGNESKLDSGLRQFFDTGEFFDDETEDAFNDRAMPSHSKFVSDVTVEEIDTVLTVRSDGSLKKSGSKQSTSHNRISAFKKKIGVITNEEVDEVIQLAKKGGIL